jgi:adenylosuccinate synthase
VGEHNQIDWATTNASANAGHTSVINGKPVVLFHIPSTWLTSREHSNTRIYINAGAIVDLDVLCQEIEELGIRPQEIFVNPNAAVILPSDAEAEKDRTSSQTKIASTQKGCGAALARKVRREGPNLGQLIEDTYRKVPFQLSTVSLNREMLGGASVVVEVPQGFSLSLNTSGFYPYTTSRDCTLQQGLSDAGIHPTLFYKSMAVLRTFPIRVGNITDENGRQLGYSGHVYPDQYEMSWKAVGQPEERTTVTKRVRRIFNFSKTQYRHMLSHSMPNVVFLNFVNYMSRGQAESLLGDMHQIEMTLGMNIIHYLGYGPSSEDISEYIR